MAKKAAIPEPPENIVEAADFLEGVVRYFQGPPQSHYVVVDMGGDEQASVTWRRGSWFVHWPRGGWPVVHCKCSTLVEVNNRIVDLLTTPYPKN